jgi:hypothetical protein
MSSVVSAFLRVLRDSAGGVGTHRGEAEGTGKEREA